MTSRQMCLRDGGTITVHSGALDHDRMVRLIVRQARGLATVRVKADIDEVIEWAQHLVAIAEELQLRRPASEQDAAQQCLRFVRQRAEEVSHG